MKQVIKSAICLLVLTVVVLAACVREDILPGGNDGKTLQLNYNVQGSSVQTLDTRAVPGTIAENRVDNLMVLFFASTTDGTGKYIGYAASVTSDNPSSASGTSRVSMPPGHEVEDAYSLIVLSNYTTYLKLGSSSSIDEYLTNALTGKTQQEARILIRGYADSPTGIKATDGLPMTSEYNKPSGTNLIYINFKRIVARVDLMNSSTPSNFVLKSAQIWNVRKSCSVASNGYGAEGDFTHYRDRVVTTDNDRVEGSLYAFENNTLTSGPDDAVTTCLIVGGYYNGSTTLSYYRINVVAPGNNQTLGRNHLYTINIKSVAGEGKDNPDDAYSYNKSVVKYDINDWDDSFNGMYFFDADGNGLAVSVRNVAFANTGGQIDIEVYRIDSPDPTKRITDPWTVAMNSTGQGQSFLANRITDTERLRIAAPNENATSANREGVAEVKWGRIAVPVNVTQLSYLSQVHGIKIVPTYLRYPSDGGAKEMTVSLEGSFTGITEADVAPVIIYGEAGQSWLSAAYNASKSNPVKGVYVYDITCETMPTGKDYRTADLKVILTQEGKTVTGSVNATQARSYNPGEEGYIRAIDVIMLEKVSDTNQNFVALGSTSERYKKFEGMSADRKGMKDLHFNIVENGMRKYRIDMASSMAWRIITPGMSANLHFKVVEKNMLTSVEETLSDNEGSSGIFYKGGKNSLFFIEVSTISDAVSGWSDSFYIEFENGDTEVFRVFQTGVVAVVGENTAPKDGTAIDPGTLFYYETVIINGKIWIDRNIGAKSNGYYTSMETTYPINADAKGGYFTLEQAIKTGCPKGFRPPKSTAGSGEWDYIIGTSTGDRALVWSANGLAEYMPYKNVYFLYLSGDRKAFFPMSGPYNPYRPNDLSVYIIGDATGGLAMNKDGTTTIDGWFNGIALSLRCVRK